MISITIGKTSEAKYFFQEIELKEAGQRETLKSYTRSQKIIDDIVRSLKSSSANKIVKDVI